MYLTLIFVSLCNMIEVFLVFKNFKDNLWVEIWGMNNEYINGDHESVFDDTRLPKQITRVRFNSYHGYQIALL